MLFFGIFSIIMLLKAIKVVGRALGVGGLDVGFVVGVEGGWLLDCGLFDGAIGMGHGDVVGFGVYAKETPHLASVASLHVVSGVGQAIGGFCVDVTFGFQIS